MQQLYLPIDGKVFISDNGNMTAKLKLDNSEGGRELELGFRVDGETPTNGWWESNNKLVERTIKNVPNDVLNYLGLGYADDQIKIKYTVDTSTWSAILEKESVKVTRLARGFPIGGDLEFVDDATIMRAIEDRSLM